MRFVTQRSDAAEAEDLVQETFVRAYRSLHRYRSRWRFTTWLFTIARRVSINQFRRQRPTADSEVLESAEAETRQPLDLLAEKESRRRLWQLAGEVLTERQMTAVWLYYVEEMPGKEIGRVIGCSQGAVKTVLFRARKKLIPLLQDYHRTGSLKNSSCQRTVELTNG